MFVKSLIKFKILKFTILSGIITVYALKNYCCSKKENNNQRKEPYLIEYKKIN